MKTCTVCNEEKNESEFYKLKDKPNTYAPECKTCTITLIIAKRKEYKKSHSVTKEICDR